MAKSRSGENKPSEKISPAPAKVATPPPSSVIAPEHVSPLLPPITSPGGGLSPNKRKVYLPPKVSPKIAVSSRNAKQVVIAVAATPSIETPVPAQPLAPAPVAPVAKAKAVTIPNSVLPQAPPAIFASDLKLPLRPKPAPARTTKLRGKKKSAEEKVVAPAKSPFPVPTTSKAEPEAASPVALARIARASASAAKAMEKSAPKAKEAAPAAPPDIKSTGKRIVFIASECTPLAHTGGLGDVVAGLSKALRKHGHDARIIMPLYRSIDRQRFGITFSRACCVHFGGGEEIWVGIFEAKLDGEVPIWFIDYERYFGRPYIYDDQEDSFRFGLLSKAALQVCKDLDWIPHVAHVHDWMTSMAAVFLKTWDRVLSPLSTTASVLTIHNIGYQGKFNPSVLPFYGLGGEYLTPDRLEDFGELNLLKAGIQYADAVTTVSPTYAREIRGPVGGMGMALYLNNRSEHVFGIVNGVDTTSWNPATDKYLPARYGIDNMAGKAVCKKALQERFGLTVDPKIPLFGIVSRFAPQKGFDLIRGALPQAMRTCSCRWWCWARAIR